MSDNHRALQLAVSDLERAYRHIASLENRLAAQSGWAEDETIAELREQIVTLETDNRRLEKRETDLQSRLLDFVSENWATPDADEIRANERERIVQLFASRKIKSPAVGPFIREKHNNEMDRAIDIVRGTYDHR